MPKTHEHDLEVHIVLFDEFSMFELGVVSEIFGKDRPEVGPNWYVFKTVGPKRRISNCRYSVNVDVDLLLPDLKRADMIVIPGWQHASADVPQELLVELKRAHSQGTRILSLCNGVAVLAATGLLDGKLAATHWRDFEYLQERYPKIQFQNDVLYVDSEDVATSAGSSAAIDLCLHQIRRDFGVKAANVVAKRTVVAGFREGGQAQFMELPKPKSPKNQNMANTMNWLENNFQNQIQIKDAAAHARMSERTFQRRFIEGVGVSFGVWLHRKRLRVACILIEEGNQKSLDEVAEQSGFSTLSTMQHHFTKTLGISPRKYAKNFAAKQFEQ